MMFYGFRIRPFARLFLAVVLLWLAFTCARTVDHVPPFAGALFIVTAGLGLLAALVILRGLTRMGRAYGRTWRG